MRAFAVYLLPLVFALPQEGRKMGAWDTSENGRTAMATGQTAVGDAVISNGRVTVVARKADAGIEVYSGEDVLRARLVLHGAARLERVVLAENAKSVVALEVVCKTAKGSEVTAKFRLKRGEVFVEVEPGAGAERLRIECPSRFVVLPDFFADDIVIDPAKIPLASVEVPSENFLLHLAGSGDSIALCVFENREQDARVLLAGESGKRTISGSEIDFGKGRKIWLALLEGPQTWHSVDVKESDAKKILPLEWKMPFPAQWRCDFTRTNDLTDSWEMLLQEKKDGEFQRQEWFDDWSRKIPSDRKRWTTVLGRFPYPCWVDHEKRGFLQPLRHEALEFRGPAIIYPVNRVKQTPHDTFTLVDVVRSTLGVGPCEYILDVEGQKEDNKGNNTCSVRDAFTEIWGKGMQKQKRKEIEKHLADALTFVTHIRRRIEMYIEFGVKIRETLAGRKKAHPELEGFISEMEKITGEIDGRFAARRDRMKTPAHVAGLNDDFRKNVLDYEGPDALDRVKKYGAALTDVGDSQDEMVGECRWIVKTLRQRAGLAMALDPKAAPVAEEIRAMTQKILRSPSALERARH